MEPRRFDGEALRRARTELGLSQEQAAARLEVDVRTYRRYETGQVNEPGSGFAVRHAARRRLLDRIQRELGLGEEELLVPAPGPAPATAAATASMAGHALPPARHFVGREALLDELAGWARDPAPRERVLALVAVGGAGKTSLLARLLATLAGDPAGFAWSFYEDPRGEAFLLAAGRALGAPSELPPVDALLAALGAGPPRLLALDGLEVLQAPGGGGRARGELEDPWLRRLLRGLAGGAGAARAILTSRLEPADLAAWEGSGARTVRLPPLRPEESQQLLRRWGVEGSAAELGAVARELEGHALAVAVAGSYAAGFLGGRAERLAALRLGDAAQDDPLARKLAAVLEAYVRELPPLERQVLARLALFPGGLADEALEALWARDPLPSAEVGLTALAPAAGELTRALARLERRGLVHRGGGGHVLHPFLGAWCREALAPRDARPVHALQAARLERLMVSARDAAPEDADEQADRQAEALLEQALRADRPGEAWRVYARLLGGYGRLGLRAGAMLRGARALAAFAEGGDPLRLRQDLAPDLRAALAYEWALYAEALGELDLALRCLDAQERAIAAAGGLLHADAALTTSWRARAYVLRLQGRLPAALAAAGRSRLHAEAAGSEPHLARTLALEAVVLHDLGQEPAAAAAFARARQVEGREPGARRALWLAEHLLERDPARARALAEREGEACAARGWVGHEAQARALQGRLCLLERPARVEEARGHLDRALRWAATSGEVEAQLRARCLAARLALAEGDPSAAAGEARAGEELVAASGARWFAPELGALAAAALMGLGQGRQARERAEAALREATTPERGQLQAARELRRLLEEPR